MNILKEVVLEEVKCPLGCSMNDETVLTGRDRLHNIPGEFTIVKCPSCELMRTNPRPTPDTIGCYYPDDYGPYLGTQVRDAAPTPPSWIKRIIKPVLKQAINFNATNLPVMTPGRMLEIGCASGAFLHHMASQGWQVQGIEYSETAAKEASKLGYNVHVGPLETAPEPNEQFDLIAAWMVLEHLHDPVMGLKKLRQWAKPGAFLVLSVPNAGSLEFRVFGDKWYALQLPTHLYHFTPETLRKVLAESGWKLEKIYHQRNVNNLIASIGYYVSDKGYKALGQRLIDFPGQAGRWMYVLYPLAWLMSLFGQTGRMTAWARMQ